MRSSTKNLAKLVAVLAVFGVLAAACGGSSSKTSAKPESSYDYASLTGTLNGSGATFPKAFYEESIAGFESLGKVSVNYNAVGSGQGKKDLAAGTSDWAGTDSLVSDADKATFKGPFLYFPTDAAPITVSYNLAGVSSLQLSADTLAKVFTGSITMWNDAAIAADNSGVSLPNTPITVAVRSDGSGTTSNFSKYLAAAAPNSFTITAGDTVAWPHAQAAKGNAGVAQVVKSTNGSIGYVDLSDAVASGLKYASIQNKDGKFVQPTTEGASAALAGAILGADLTYSALNASGADAYPITAGTYIIAYSKISDASKASAIRGWLNYVLTDGQKLANDVDFAPLPESIRIKALAQIASIQS